MITKTINNSPKAQKKRSLREDIKRHWILYAMISFGLLYFLVFKYAPMFGLVIAFQDYNIFLGVLQSEFVGFKHFIRFFSEPIFFDLLINTLILFILNMLIAFPVPIILALMLNEVRTSGLRKSVQTVVYLPHFISWVIVVSMFFVLLSTEGGAINNLLVAMGFEQISFLTDPNWLRPMYIIQNIWKGAGWSSIIYLAALTGVDEQLYEASEMDGCGRFKQIWHITLPAIRPTIIIMLILKVGDVLELGFEHMYLITNSINREVAQIFDTYVYQAGIQNGQMSYSAAVGIFKSIVGLALVIFANKMAKKFGEDGVY